MTTVHAMTATQLTVDGPSRGGKDWRGGRRVGGTTGFSGIFWTFVVGLFGIGPKCGGRGARRVGQRSRWTKVAFLLSRSVFKFVPIRRLVPEFCSPSGQAGKNCVSGDYDKLLGASDQIWDAWSDFGRIRSSPDLLRPSLDGLGQIWAGPTRSWQVSPVGPRSGWFRPFCLGGRPPDLGGVVLTTLGAVRLHLGMQCGRSRRLL